MTTRSPHYNLRTRPRVTYARASREHLAEAAATSPIAFIPSPHRSTPPGAKLDRSKYPHLKFVACSAYGEVTETTCRSRYAKAQADVKHGKGVQDAISCKWSACEGCDREERAR